MNSKVILIVDDEPTNITIVANILDKNYQLKIATNGVKALEILEKEHVDLILLDVIMPDINGYEVALKLLSNEKIKHIPFIFLTALKDPEHVREGFEHGAVDYIAKPFSKEELQSRVLTHLRLNHLQKSLSETVENLHEQIIVVENSKKEFESIFNYSKDGIAILDKDLQFLNFNKAYLEMLDYTNEELYKKTCLELTVVEDRERSREIFDLVVQSGHIENVEKVCLSKNGQRVNINVSISLLPDKKRFLLVAKDVTSLKSLEEHSRLASMGEMIGNIAHQWRQPLSIISTAASGTKMSKEYNVLDDATFNKNMDLIVKEADYLSHTIDDFRSFLIPNEVLENISIKTLIEETIILIEASIKNNFITLVLDLKGDAIINCCKGEIIHSFINIINNSIDSLVEHIVSDADRYLFITSKKIDTNIIEMKIYDSGGGIDDDVKNRIFEPYFTTKHQSIGTGIGLTTTYKLLHEKHNCNLKVYNKEFEYDNKQLKGACFSIECQTVKNK